MRAYTLSDGAVIDLDQISIVEPVNVSKVSAEYSGYNVCFVGGSSISLIDIDDSRSALLAEWGSVQP